MLPRHETRSIKACRDCRVTDLLQCQLLHRIPEGQGPCEQLIHEHPNAPLISLLPILLHDDLCSTMAPISVAKSFSLGALNPSLAWLTLSSKVS